MKIKNFTLKLFATYLLTQIIVGQVFSQELSKMKPVGIPGFKVNKINAYKTFSKTDGTIVSDKESPLATKAPGDTLFFQNFSATLWPANMPRLNVDGLTPNYAFMGNNAWIPVTITGIPGRYAASTSWYIPNQGTSNDWMITPPLAITEGNSLSWKAMVSQATAADGYEVRVCTNCPATFTAANVLSSFATSLFSIDEEQGTTFIKRELSLSAYNGQTIRLAFRNNTTGGNLLFIDDICVYKVPPADASAEAILSPDSAIYDCEKTNFLSAVTIKNKGSKTIKFFKVKLESTGPINDSVVQIVDSLEAGLTSRIIFQDGLDLSAAGTYQLKLTVKANGDQITGNDVKIETYKTASPLDGLASFDFEDLTSANELPENWFSSSLYFPNIKKSGFNGGNGLRFPVFHNNANPNIDDEPENQIVTNQFANIPAGQTFSLKIKISGQTNPDYVLAAGDTVSVGVLKNCVPVGNPILITADNQVVSTEFQKFFLPLDSYGITSADKVSFIIKGIAAPTTPWFYVGIDDVSLGVIENNDVAIINIQKPQLTIVKRNQVTPFQVKGVAFNEGVTPISPVRISATFNPLAIQDTARISTIGAGLSRNFTTLPGFNVNTTGEYTIDVNTLPGGQTDPNPANNTVIFPLTISDSTLGKDIGDQFVNSSGASGLGYGPSQGGLKIIATSITTKVRDTLTSVSVFVGSLTDDVVGKSFFASVNQSGNYAIDTSTTIVTITADQENNWHTFRHRLRLGTPASIRERGKAVAPNTTNLYGVRIISGDLRVGFNFEGAEDNGSYVYFPGSTTPFTPTQDVTVFGLGGPFNLFIRPNFGRPSTILSASQLEKSLQFAELIPNPSNGNSTLSIQLNKGRTMGIQIFSTDGRLINSKTTSTNVGDNRIDLPVAGLQKGIYLVKVAAEGFSVTKKLVVE